VRQAHGVLAALHAWASAHPGALDGAPRAALTPLLAALLERLGDDPMSLAPLELIASLEALAGLGLRVQALPGNAGGDPAAAGAPPPLADAGDGSGARAAGAVAAILSELAAGGAAAGAAGHDPRYHSGGGGPPGLLAAPPGALPGALRALRTLGVAPGGAFLAAAQARLRGALAGRPPGEPAGWVGGGLPVGEFCAFAEAAAGFGARLEQELIDAYLEAAAPDFGAMPREWLGGGAVEVGPGVFQVGAPGFARDLGGAAAPTTPGLCLTSHLAAPELTAGPRARALPQPPSWRACCARWARCARSPAPRSPARSRRRCLQRRRLSATPTRRAASARSRRCSCGGKTHRWAAPGAGVGQGSPPPCPFRLHASPSAHGLRAGTQGTRASALGATKHTLAPG
jgi:hypothetical protein